MKFRQKNTTPKSYNILEKLKTADQERTEDDNVYGRISLETGVNEGVKVGNLGNLVNFARGG